MNFKQYSDPGPADRFEAEMFLLNNPEAVCCWMTACGKVGLRQGEDSIVFVSPEYMAAIAKEMLKTAEEWRKGNIPKPSTTKGTP